MSNRYEDSRTGRYDSGRSSRDGSFDPSEYGEYGYSSNAYPTGSDAAGAYGRYNSSSTIDGNREDADVVSRFRRSEYGTGRTKQRSTDSSSGSLEFFEGDAETTNSRRTRARRSEATDGRRRPSIRTDADQEYEAGGPTSPKPKNPNRKRNLIVAAVVAVAIVLAGAGLAFGFVSNITGNLHEGVDQNLRDALVETDMAKEPFYILLLGTDKSAERAESEDFGGAFRSDSMMLARIDPVNKKVAMVSIPRDTLVDLGEHGWNKINAAYAYGGPALAVEAVSKLANVPISHYAEIDFNGFSAMVDAMGGVEVEVPIDIDDPDAGGKLNAGLQTLNGEQALILCRSRESYAQISAQPDLMRAANQRMVLSAIAHKLLKSDIATIANTVRAVSEYVTTDLDLNDIIGIAQTMQGLDSANDIYTATLPTKGAYIVNGAAYTDPYSYVLIEAVSPYIDEGWYMLMDDDEWKSMVKRMNDGQPPSEGAEIDPATGTVLATAGADAADTSDKSCWITVANGTGRNGLGASVAQQLNDAGYKNVTVIDATAGYEYPETLVVYDEPGRSYEAENLAKIVGQGRAYLNNGDYIVENQYLIVIGEDWVGSASSKSASSSSAASASSNG